MPYIVTAEELGQRVKAKYPGAYDDKDDAEVGHAMSAKHPDAYQIRPSIAAHAPAPDMGDKGAFQRTVDDVFANNDKPGSEALRPVGNIGRRAVRSLTSQVTELPGKLANIKPYDPKSSVDSLDAGRKAYVQTAKDKGLVQAGTDVAGDLLAAELGGKATEAAIEPAAATLNATGRLTRKIGAYGVRKGVGLESPKDAMGADAASALTRNRIVGTSPKSLLRKIEARVEPMSQARDSILSRSQAPATDVAPDVTRAFADTLAPKVDPKTGAAQPGSVARATTSRRVIQEEVDPDTGRPTGSPKDSNLSPLEMSRLQRNVYDMTDYTNPESDLANTALKATGAKLRDRIRSAAPEANTMTDALHDTMGAREQLRPKAQVPEGEVHGIGQLGLRAGKRLMTGGITAAGALADVAGSGMQNAAGALRSKSPVGTAAPSARADAPPAPRQLPSDTIANADPSTPVDPGSPVGPTSPARPVPPTRRPLLSQVAGPITTGRGPGNVVSGEVTRVQPTVTRPRTQQVAPDQPGYLPTRGGRRLIATPEGIRPEPIILDMPRPQPRLDTPAGNRRSLVQQLRDGTQRAGEAHESSIQASRDKLASIPEGQAPPAKNFAKVAGGKTRAARAKLAEHIEEGEYSLLHPTEAYHGTTPEAAARIEKEGLKPGGGDSGTAASGEDFAPPVSLAVKKSLAERFATHRSGGKPGTIFKAKIPARTRMINVEDQPAGAEELGVKGPIPASLLEKVTGTKVTTRLPDPTDIDAWEALVDEGKARYNTKSHTYDYIGGRK